METPSCIGLIKTNSPLNFQNSCVLKTGLSEFRKMTVLIMKTTFNKDKKVIHYRNYKYFLAINLD